MNELILPYPHDRLQVYSIGMVTGVRKACGESKEGGKVGRQVHVHNIIDLVYVGKSDIISPGCCLLKHKVITKFVGIMFFPKSTRRQYFDGLGTFYWFCFKVEHNLFTSRGERGLTVFLQLSQKKSLWPP